jgi:hypothetical protein
VKRLVLAVALLAAACSKNIQNSDAVRQGVLDYLTAKAAQTGLNMANITIDVTALEFERDSARASVNFRVKGSPDNAGMSMNYTLDRKGDKWVVRGGAEGASNPHGGVAPNTVPNGDPSGDASGAMPPGHPPVGAGAVGAAGTAGSKE